MKIKTASFIQHSSFCTHPSSRAQKAGLQHTARLRQTPQFSHLVFVPLLSCSLALCLTTTGLKMGERGEPRPRKAPACWHFCEGPTLLSGLAAVKADSWSFSLAGCFSSLQSSSDPPLLSPSFGRHLFPVLHCDLGLSSSPLHRLSVGIPMPFRQPLG